MDDVTLPGVGEAVATRQLDDDSHVQIVQSTLHQVDLVAIIAPATPGGYLAGEQMGELVLIQDVPEGQYQVASAALVDMTSSLAVPEFMPYGYGQDAGATPPAFPGDGDALDPDLGYGGLGSLFMVPPDLLSYGSLPGVTHFKTAQPSVPSPLIAPVAGTTQPSPALVDMYLGVIATENTAVDLTGGLILSVQLVRVGSSADRSTFIGT